MKSQILVIAGLLLVPFAVRAAAEVQVSEGCECLTMHTPMLEKVATQCSVEEKAPEHCFKVEKIAKTTDLYKIPSHCNRCCTITDENGSRPCGCGEGLSCPCQKACPKKCCAPKCHKPRCNKCETK